MSASAAVKAKAKSRVYLDDVVSSALFAEWHAYAMQQGVDKTDFFFPSLGKSGFLWQCKLSYALADKLVQEAAAQLGLHRDSSHLKTFTTKALRRGTGADSTKACHTAVQCCSAFPF